MDVFLANSNGPSSVSQGIRGAGESSTSLNVSVLNEITFRLAFAPSGMARYLPFPGKVLLKVFQNPEPDELVHPDWHVQRIGFQPYPFPSATRFIIDRMRQTLVEGNTAFLDNLDTKKAAHQLVDDSFVIKAMDKTGGMKKFCNCDMTKPYSREETIEIS
jgi:hypothetical protein